MYDRSCVGCTLCFFFLIQINNILGGCPSISVTEPEQLANAKEKNHSDFDCHPNPLSSSNYAHLTLVLSATIAYFLPLPEFPLKSRNTFFDSILYHHPQISGNKQCKDFLDF